MFGAARAPRVQARKSPLESPRVAGEYPPHRFLSPVAQNIKSFIYFIKISHIIIHKNIFYYQTISFRNSILIFFFLLNMNFFKLSFL